MEVNENYNIINHMLLRNIPNEYQKHYSFLVHSSIYSMVLKYFTRSGIQILQQLGRYELTVGAHTFEMEILVLGSQSRSYKAYKVFTDLFEISQFTYFWDEKTTLFREVDRYYQLEEFITISDLNKHVISVEQISGINTMGLPIKVITFGSTIQQDQLLNKFKWFLYKKGYHASPYPTIYHYYFTNAFPWHQPEFSAIYSIPTRNQRFFLGLQTFLTCMRELSYTREPHLDLISLCSLKLAFCDDRNLTEASCDLGCEIDALIERFLRRMQQKQTYIRNGSFSLYEYAIDTNASFNTSYPAIPNLVYTFQKFFHRTNLSEFNGYEAIQSRKFTDTLKLIDENIDLKKLRCNSHIFYEIDGKYYEHMNSKLFCKLLKCNVNRIRLDTNYKWTNEPYLIDFDGNDNGKWIRIELVGTNQFNFIEDFIQFLKKIPVSLTSKMTLEIPEVTLKSYNIFNNLEIEAVHFVASMITFAMLTGLSDDLVNNLKIRFNNCTIEDRTCTWSVLINELNHNFVSAQLVEGENIWQYLFESIINHLTKFKLNEFKFESWLSIRSWNYEGLVIVSQMKFRFDEFNTRLELQNKFGDEIDLYNWRNTVDESEDDCKNFEFYQ